jgi:hypothetical protein
VVWSTTANPTISLTTKTQDGTGSGTFTSTITSLTSGTTYYYRAYATNGNGTAYGAQLSLTTLPNLPTVTTTSASSVTLTSAVTGGNVTSSGGGSITARGVCYATTPNPTISNFFTSNGTGTGSFTSNLTGLTQNTIYYVRAYATNAAGTNYGSQISFSTSSTTIPTVTTTTISNIDYNSALSGGNVTSDGNSTVTSKGVCWSTSLNPSLSDNFTNDGAGTGSFNSQITGLTAGTTYYVRSYAVNGIGTAYGSNVSFNTTPGVIPTITSDNVTNVTNNNASVTYTIVSAGGGTLSEAGFVWSTSSTPTTSNNIVGGPCATESPCDPGQYTLNFVASLSPSTTYYIRAYAINEFGTTYGSQLSFTTLADFASLTTTAISGITSVSATSGGTILGNGGASITSRGVCWSTSPAPTTSNNITVDGSGNGSFTSNITGLVSGTLYYVRAYATNSTGTAYGNQVTFTTTTVSLPTLTTSSITSITSTTASGGGNVTSDGGSSVTARGVCWSTNQNPTINDSKTTNGSGTGVFTSSLTGLSAGTTYYVRSYATTVNGTSYGLQVSFTTSIAVATVTTTSVSGITSTTAISGGNVTASGGSTVTSRGVCWSTTTNPTISNSKTIDGSGIGTFTSNITGLTANTLYYVRSYATNSSGTSYGSQSSFTTSSGGGSCSINNLIVQLVSGQWNFRFDINPNCTSYTVNVCRYSNTNPSIPPTTGQTPVACAIRNNMSGYVPTSSEISTGFITRVMSPAPANTKTWYSVDVTCNGSCTGTKTTRSAYFYQP